MSTPPYLYIYTIKFVRFAHTTKIAPVAHGTNISTKHLRRCGTSYPAGSGGVEREELLELRPREVPHVFLALYVAAHDRPPQTVLKYLRVQKSRESQHAYAERGKGLQYCEDGGGEGGG